MTSPSDSLLSSDDDWCVRFVERRCGSFSSVPLRHEGRAPAGKDGTPGPLILSLAEMNLVTGAQKVTECDFLAVLGLRAGKETGGQRLWLHFVTPGTMRSAGRASGARWVINDIPLLIPPEVEEVSLLVYCIRRTLRMERLLAGIVKLVEALEVVGSDDHLALGRAVLERIEVLDDAQEVEVVLSGCGLHFGDRSLPGSVPSEERYLAVIRGDPETLPMTNLWLTDRGLCEGPDRTTAKPVDGRSFVLLRLGGGLTRQSGREFIAEIRRRHRRRPGEPSSSDETESFASFVGRQVDKQRQERIKEMFGHHFMLPVVTPIALEVAQDLVETVQLTGDSPSGLKQLVEEMRTSIGVTLGIRPPGIRIRGNEVDMPPASYLIMLDEIPRVMGTVDPRKVLCLADISALSDASLEGVQNLQAAEKASPPPDKSGRAATWCPVEWSEALGKAGFETWDAAKYIQEHLGSVLIANLEMFVTMDAIEQDLLKIDASGALFERLRGARGGVARFVEVARSLLMEELAIAPTNTLISHYLACVEEPTVEVAERMRQTPAIHAQLTRDVADWCLYVLADSYEARLREGVHQGKDGAVLSLEPEATQELLAAVRTAVGSLTQDKRQVLVVQDWYLRPFVRSLLVLEFPDLRVVARREIESLAGVPPPTAAISWEP